MDVRFTNDVAVTASAAYVGIGDVFIIAGQSNASGRGTNVQSYSHASLKATMLGNDYVWKELADPVDSSVSQVDVVSADVALNSFWPLLTTSIMADQGVPIAFVPCAKGGTSVADWQPGVDHSDRSTLYGSMNYRATQTGGAKCVLWWQGENDVLNGTLEAAYNAALDSLANAINADQSIELMACKLQDLSTWDGGYDETAVNAAINTAWGDNANVLQGPDFSDITPGGDGVHFRTDAELTTAATRWWTAIEAEFYP